MATDENTNQQDDVLDLGRYIQSQINLVDSIHIYR